MLLDSHGVCCLAAGENFSTDGQSSNTFITCTYLPREHYFCQQPPYLVLFQRHDIKD